MFSVKSDQLTDDDEDDPPKKKIAKYDNFDSPGHVSSSSNKFSVPQPSAPTSSLMLPEISPLYKPLPRPPIQSRHHSTEEEALDRLMGQKKSRNVVYSGKKRQRFFEEVPSLYDQCIMVLQDNVDAIDEVGDLTYDILEPVLQRASAPTLMHIEDLNPGLMVGDTNTSSLWEKHCKNEFRGKSREEMESWREMYERCKQEREIKLDQLKGKVKNRVVAEQSAVRQTKLAYPDVIAKPPRDVLRKQAKHGTGLPSGTVNKVGPQAVRPRVSDPTAGQAARPQAQAKKSRAPPMMQKAKAMMKGMSRFGRR